MRSSCGRHAVVIQCGSVPDPCKRIPAFPRIADARITMLPPRGLSHGARVDATLVVMQSHTDAHVGSGRTARGGAPDDAHDVQHARAADDGYEDPGVGGEDAGDAGDGRGDAPDDERRDGAHVEVIARGRAAAESERDDQEESAGEACGDLPLEARVEALLFASDRPLSEPRLTGLLGIAAKGSAARLQQCVAALNEQYDVHGRAFRIERLAGGYQVLTRTEFGPLLLRQHRDRQQSRLTPSAMETLSIIAYRQPVLRAEIEAIRGVACGEVLRGLLERRMIRIAGRAEELGRPMLYGTTQEFLKVFGLASLDDLPAVAGDDPRNRRPAVKSAEARPHEDAEAHRDDAQEDVSSEESHAETGAGEREQ